MEMWSRLTGEPPLTVIFAVRRFVFICGETDAIEPLMIVPDLSSTVTVSFVHFIRNLTSFMIAVVLSLPVSEVVCGVIWVQVCREV